MSKNVLELQDVSVSFDNGKTYILKDISFSVGRGEVVSIIGMNGTGKSTLLKTIADIQKPSGGSIGRNYDNYSYVPQKINVDMTFPLSVEEFIKIYNTGVKKQEIEGLARKFSIYHVLKSKVSYLSGGEFQKMLIVSALLSNPELLLLDEPTAGIDVIGEEEFYKNIAELKQIFPDISIVLVSHNLHLVYKNSDKVICLHKNNFCCHGTPSQVEKNKDVQKLFGKFVAPYEHNPHEKHSH